MRRFTSVALVVAVLVTAAACEEGGSVLVRPAEPVVVTGAELPDLLGADPATVVAFRHHRVDGQSTWTQVPVQIDQRKVVDFGSHPSSNTTPGAEGTVYGGPPIGVTALQYADPSTFVGADTDPAFDADDELVVMGADLGGAPEPGEATEPEGVVAGSGVAVRAAQPGQPANAGWIHLFRTDSGLSPDAGRDYVDYRFSLTSGDYRSTYRRGFGPNPETSEVTTDGYTIGFSDRWYEDRWQITEGDATGVDVLDGNMNQFSPAFCGRSNATFAAGEGAFVANVDGPVRAIRSYVGANSGPLTQRTHLLYRDREEIVTDLRVHAIPAVMDFLDLSAAAQGMTYRSSTVPHGVTVDGSPDAVPTAVPDWEAVHGEQGTVLTTLTYDTTIPALEDGIVWFHRDQVSPPSSPCWGDDSYYGAAGSHLASAIPNTDPRMATSHDLEVRRVVQFEGPVADGFPPIVAETWAAQVHEGLEVTTAPFLPGG